MSTVAKKVIMGSGAVDVPSDDDFNTVGFLSHFDGANSGVNNVFDDSSDSNHTITAVGSVNQGSFSPYSPAYGIQAVNGVTQNRKFALSTVANAYGAWTVEWWFRADAASVSWQQMITEWDNGSTSQQCWEVFVSAGFIRTYVRDSGSNSYSTALSGVSAAAVTSGKWHYLSVADDGSNFRVHLDGALIQKDSRVPQSGSTGRFMIGFDQAATTFAGTLADVKVSDVSRYTDSTYAVPTVVGGLVDSDTLLLVGGNNARDLRGNYAASTIVAYPVVPTAQVGRVKAYDPAVDGGSATGSGTSYLTAAPSSDFAIGTSDFCIEMWLFPATTPDAALEIPFSTRRTASGNYMFLHYDNNQISIGTSGQFKLNLATTAIKPFQWNHVCWARSSGVSMAFINGVKIGQANDTTDYLQEGVTVFGVSTDQEYTGNMAGFRFVNGSNPRGTSTFDIPTTAPTAVTNTKLLLNMANAQAFDSAAFNNLTLYGNARINTAQKKIGNSSVYFDGSGDYLTFPESAANDIDGGTDWTVEFYFYPSNVSSVLKEIVSKEAGFQLYMYDSQLGLALSANNSGSYIFNTMTGAALNISTWYHIAAVHYGNTYKLYVDGTLTAINTTSTSNISTGAKWEIGGYIGGQYPTEGHIDEFRISKIARYTSNFTPDTEPFPDKGP